MTLKIDNAIEEIERAFAGNKPKYANDIYLNNAIRYLQEIKSPSLTDDQQVVLEWLKQYREEQGENPLNTVSTLIDMYCADPAGGEVPLPSNVKEAYKKLNDEQEFQVLAAFAEWGSKEVNQ